MVGLKSSNNAGDGAHWGIAYNANLCGSDVTNEHVLRRKVTDAKPVVSENLLKPSLVLASWENDCHRLL